MSDVIKLAQTQEGGLGGKLSSLWESIPAEYRPMIIRSLIGAAIGGTVLGGSRMLSGKDEEGQSGALRQALLGLVLGATAGGASTMLPKMNINLPGQQPAQPARRGPGERIAGNSGALAGAGAYHAMLGRHAKPLEERMSSEIARHLGRGKGNNTGGSLTRRNAKALNNTIGQYKRDVHNIANPFNRLLQSSETVARMNTSPLMERLRSYSGTAPANATLLGRIGAKGRNFIGSAANKVPTDTLKTRLYRDLTTKTPSSNVGQVMLSGVRPRRLGRGLNAAGYVGSATVGRALTKAITNHIMDRG